jgi:CMP-N-acetylneuraminic acid synthetase|tara:strand:- start:708 stop:1409 length:702 start_codon:yes stop_codon:yes gene_type:complete
MKNVNDIVFIIQARLCSERLPQKMLKPFADTNLMQIFAQKISESQIIPPENFYISVHEPELIQFGKDNNLNVFERSKESCLYEGDVPIGVMYEWWDKLPYKYCVLINACAPFLEVATIDSFVETYIQSDFDGMFAVMEKKNYFWNKEGQFMTRWPEGQTALNTKAVGITYEAAHCLYAGKMEPIGEGVWMGDFNKPGDIELFPIKEEEAFDIDYPWQFKMAEARFSMEKHNDE